MAERIISFDSHGTLLHGILREPVRGVVRGLVLICDPFAEEKKCAHRPLTDLARAMVQTGLAVMRFDYRGTGDSAGEFQHFTPDDWRADIHAAADFARREVGLSRLTLAGLRMGANLALSAACDRDDVNRVILWEPVLDGKQYVSQNMRRSLVKAMLTAGDEFKAATVTEAHAQAVVDFDGYTVTGAARLQLEALRLAPFPGAALLAHIGPKEEPGPAYVAAAQALPQCTARGLRLEPFWNRIGLMDVTPLAELTMGWLAGR